MASRAGASRGDGLGSSTSSSSSSSPSPSPSARNDSASTGTSIACRAAHASFVDTSRVSTPPPSDASSGLTATPLSPRITTSSVSLRPSHRQHPGFVYSTSAAADAAAADADDEDEDARAATARGRRDDDARGGAGADARTLDEHAIARDARSDPSVEARELSETAAFLLCRLR